MKTIALILATIVFVSLATTSCKKSYTCECKRIYNKSNGSTVISDDGKYIFDDTKIRAADRCQMQEETGSDLSGDYTRECEIH